MSTDRFTEILNYLSAMSRDIGEFRMETKARLGSMETRLGGVETRLGSVETRAGSIETRLDSLETEMRSGFEQVSTDIRHLKQRFEIVSEDLMELRTDGRDIRKRMEALERKQA